MLKATEFVEQVFLLSVETIFSYQCQDPGQQVQIRKNNDLLSSTNDFRTENLFLRVRMLVLYSSL